MTTSEQSSDQKTKQPKANISHPTLTVIEGREENQVMVDGFAAAAKKLGWNFCQLKNINSDKLARYDFRDIPLDFVIFRELSANNYHETERLMYWLNAHHKITINTNVAGRRISTSDKHFQQGLFALDPFLRDYSLPTYEAKHKANVLAYVKTKRVHFPIVLKDRRGTAGKNITLVRTPKDLDEIENFGGLLIEQYIEPECDYRVFVIGGVAIGIMRKVGDPKDPGDFIAWSAGKNKHTETDLATIDILSEIATRAAAISKLEYTGVDVIKEAKTGNFYILETNIAAGWPNFIPVTHIDIPGIVVKWMCVIADGKEMSFSDALKTYLQNYSKYLPIRIQKTLLNIKKGQTNILEPYQKVFATYPHDHLYDAGYLFNHLSTAYDSITKTGIPPQDLPTLLHDIELTPFSWAGNFIGPEVGTFHDGAILSALYLYLRTQLSVKNRQN